jgi:hypothetical protein
MPAPELTLPTSGITWRTEGYGGPDNDVRLTALGELCVDVQRLARPPWWRSAPQTHQPPAGLALHRIAFGRHTWLAAASAAERPAAAPFGQTFGRSSWVPAFLPAPRGPGHGGPDQRLPGWWSWSEAAEVRWGRHLWGGCRPGRQVPADPYRGAMRRTNCGSQTRSWMTPSSRGAVVRRYFSSSGVAFASTQGTARRMWR